MNITEAFAHLINKDTWKQQNNIFRTKYRLQKFRFGIGKVSNSKIRDILLEAGYKETWERP